MNILKSLFAWFRHQKELWDDANRPVENWEERGFPYNPADDYPQ